MNSNKHGHKIVGFVFVVKQKNIKLAKTERKKQAEQKQQKKQAIENKKLKHVMDWSSIPNSIQCCHEDNTIWVRENDGFLRCSEKNVCYTISGSRNVYQRSNDGD